MSDSSFSKLCVVGISLFPAVAFGHAGHGATEASSPTHYLLEPIHAVPIVIAVLLVVAVGRGIWKRLCQPITVDSTHRSSDVTTTESR